MPQLPKTYRAVQVKSKGAPLEIVKVELTRPGPGEVLIKTIACGVCHSDIFAQQGLFGNNKFPLIPGHEVIGDVVAVGDGERVWKEGDRIGGPWHGGHDGTCKQCKRGNFQFCENELINGVTRDGGYGEYATLRTEACVRIPADVDPAAYAPILCAGITVFNGMRQMNITAGGTVAVQGLGGLGHLAIQYASRIGFRTVALSSGSAKEQFAKELGAHIYVDSSKQNATEALQKLGGADLIVATAPSLAAVKPLLFGLAKKGKLLILAPVGELPVNTSAMIGGGWSVHGWPSGHALDSEEAIQFAQVHGVNCLVETFSLDDVQKAIEHMTSGKVRFRSVIVF